MTTTEYLALRRQAVFAFEREKKRLGIKPACRAGCSLCCVYDQGVVGQVEGDFIAGLVEANPALADVRTKARESVVGQAREMRFAAAKNQVRLTPGKFPCAFLDQKTRTCRIYDLRPLSCVLAFSQSLPSCESFALVEGSKEQGWAVSEEHKMAIAASTLRMVGRAKGEQLAGMHDGVSLPINLALAARLDRDAFDQFGDELKRQRALAP